ncbi:hypothetical protein Ahp2_05 [Aeromonas phage Ahp2]|nr:hypothetical protein Ahp2_05 [Aeromonas phage Ahp2]
MTEVEKEIALLRHEANRLRLLGRMVSSKALADKASELEKTLTKWMCPISQEEIHHVVAQFMLCHPIETLYSMKELHRRTMGQLPSMAVHNLAVIIAHYPDTATKRDWAVAAHLVSKLKGVFAVAISQPNRVEEVITYLEVRRDAAKP